MRLETFMKSLHQPPVILCGLTLQDKAIDWIKTSQDEKQPQRLTSQNGDELASTETLAVKITKEKTKIKIQKERKAST